MCLSSVGPRNGHYMLHKIKLTESDGGITTKTKFSNTFNSNNPCKMFQGTKISLLLILTQVLP